MTLTRIPATVRFEQHYEPEPNSGCWIWIGASLDNGYGRFLNDAQRVVPAHRFAFERAGGVIPLGYDPDHLCRVRSCVNPAHIEPVTRRENTRRGVGVVAAHMASVACPRGHPYDETVRTRTTIGVGRRCIRCSRAAYRRYTTRKRLAMEAP